MHAVEKILSVTAFCDPQLGKNRSIETFRVRVRFNKSGIAEGRADARAEDGCRGHHRRQRLSG